jgi:hypothetical protein
MPVTIGCGESTELWSGRRALAVFWAAIERDTEHRTASFIHDLFNNGKDSAGLQNLRMSSPPSRPCQGFLSTCIPGLCLDEYSACVIIPMRCLNALPSIRDQLFRRGGHHIPSTLYKPCITRTKGALNRRQPLPAIVTP